MKSAAARECYHCKARVPAGAAHDCWTTTEEKLTDNLPEDLRDAWLRLRETAAAFGEQRIYASHKSIMFSRKNCYFFVRPQKNKLEVYFFLGRAVKHPMIRQSHQSSRVKTGHLVNVIHRDEVEMPLTDWLKEAYEVSETLRAAPKAPRKTTKKKRAAKKPVRKAKAKK